MIHKKFHLNIGNKISRKGCDYIMESDTPKDCRFSILGGTQT